LITGSTYHLTQDWFESGSTGAESTLLTTLTAIDSKTPFRPARVTPKPVAHGPHTAEVTGPSGEEIWTDEHGRVKCQFHWDREGKFDENSSCWMRVQQAHAGKTWGAIWIPRIGHEVVVDFIEGDPDRPIVVGSVYNGDNKVPYALPDNKTQSGVKTRSSKKGDTTTFNELRFEDKIGEEHVYFHAEKDFDRIVENNDTLKVGFDDKDKGDQKIEIYNDRKITIGNNETREIGYGIKKAGDQTVKVYNDRTVTIGNNDSLTVEKGNQTIDVKLGKTEHKAMKSIELKCGASSIKLDPKSITIKAPMIDIKADATLTAKSPMTTVKGDAILTLKGGITMIN
jgi:type VI secretion system secreted protein VgrG